MLWHHFQMLGFLLREMQSFHRLSVLNLTSWASPFPLCVWVLDTLFDTLTWLSPNSPLDFFHQPQILQTQFINFWGGYTKKKSFINRSLKGFISLANSEHNSKTIISILLWKLEELQVCRLICTILKFYCASLMRIVVLHWYIPHN